MSSNKIITKVKLAFLGMNSDIQIEEDRINEALESLYSNEDVYIDDIRPFNQNSTIVLIRYHFYK